MAAPLNNKFALGGNGGRPRHFETPDDLREMVFSYFQLCAENELKATVTGLALFLGFASRSSFDDYEKRGEDFSYIIKRAKLAVENSYENSGTAFDIFALKNMGWTDKTEVAQTNMNYNSEPLTKEKIKEIKEALSNDY